MSLMGLVKTCLDGILERGGMITFSDGKMFDPRDQERTTPNQDFNKCTRKPLNDAQMSSGRGAQQNNG